MNDIIKIIKSLEGSGVVTETVKHEIKKQERRILGALLAPLTTSIWQPVISPVVKGINFLAPLHPLSNIVITQYFNYERRLMAFFSRNGLPRIKDEANVINLDDKKVKKQIGFHYLLK